MRSTLEGPFFLGDSPHFPHPSRANRDGLLAVGGDLSPDRLLNAYSQGIFPWPLLGDGAPMLWWTPDPRFVLFPDELHVGRTLRRTLKKTRFDVRFDQRFEEVIASCAVIPRPGQEGTWITEEMVAAYLELHERGHAHSVECYLEDQLVGGLYGVSIGRAFFGESMFARVDDASKVAFVTLVARLKEWGFELIDCQQETDHLARFGARPIARGDFLRRLESAVFEATPSTLSWR